MIDKLNFNKGGGLLPAVVQDETTGQVLMVGFMNKEAVKKTLESRRVTFYSRSRQELWTKGETSGNYLNLTSVIADCDSDTLLIKASPTGPVCHLGNDTCFDEQYEDLSVKFLENIIRSRIEDPQTDSYTNSLIDKGLTKIAQKVGEESVELILEAESGSDERLVSETADLMYHVLVLLNSRGISFNKVVTELQNRHKG